MSIVKTALVAASFVFAVTAANAQGREDLEQRLPRQHAHSLPQPLFHRMRAAHSLRRARYALARRK